MPLRALLLRRACVNLTPVVRERLPLAVVRVVIHVKRGRVEGDLLVGAGSAETALVPVLLLEKTGLGGGGGGALDRLSEVEVLVRLVPGEICKCVNKGKERKRKREREREVENLHVVGDFSRENIRLLVAEQRQSRVGGRGGNDG